MPAATVMTSELRLDQGFNSENINILIVEDDFAYAHLIARYVKQVYPRASVDICDTASKAIEQCHSSKYDVLLIDYNLPDLSGSNFLHKLQSEVEFLPPPAIVLTADGGVSAAGEALRANAYDFLIKQNVTKESLWRSMKNAMAKYVLERSIRERTIELEDSNRSLQEKSREIRDFYQTVSHEVKTPLAANREFVSLVRDGVLGSVTEEQAEALDYALASCDQITSHFNDLVEMTRLDAGKITLRQESIAIRNLIKRTMASCARALEDKGISLVHSDKDLDHSVYVDGDRLTQVLSNLLSNAVKYTPSNGKVELSVDVSEMYIKFCVDDSGCGIEEKNLDCIFNRLFQVGDEERHEYSGAGLGLGLSIAREIVALHKGKIWVNSEFGKGSQFYVEIPRIRENSKGNK